MSHSLFQHCIVFILWSASNIDRLTSLSFWLSEVFILEFGASTERKQTDRLTGAMHNAASQ